MAAGKTGSVENGSTDIDLVVLMNAAFYVLSGCSQPLLMTSLKDAGVADPSCQLYMFFYYLGPACFIFTLLGDRSEWPSNRAIIKAVGIAMFDIVAAAMNYTGASMAGPTIFAIVYSSVTVWAALFSQLFLGRKMNLAQWMFVLVVFGGLTLTTSRSMHLGSGVLDGLVLILFGSMMHALTYVMCEAIMTVGEHTLTIRQNCAIQGNVAAFSYLFWQLMYTYPRFEEKIWEPMQDAGSTIAFASFLLLAFALSNTVHSITFFHTLKKFPGGATSAGVMKGLQAVLVFALTDWAYCGKTGGEEMCFTQGKFLSLVTVTGGVVGYGYATQKRRQMELREEAGYEEVANVGVDALEAEKYVPID
mmetsp:Transcript_35654/g.86313  ORF Transcript_35654/g.86313 Transcript_35654/m.86313 type:complete len:361 (+) Transcript_35654:90-1172(+)|eukprot:CAMPEP_0113604458 /NCGR_PEP_ID=MMETSP0017_2-20120614/1806_1 /TAXON_ID=2856 /ORGANISM="Cylindrotheca closterium" /LENGTH=360 /DNA_ID=CAMNT_0000512885 /DNA_START=83 /DNA_END=1165 /DNA_ORIENTATION=- /assembly_acc=CAM_ASM_000147